ncbi:timeless-domain-containing protein [Backusella circina FSU 941]|nr:timeless-domain-containing protein [Backusella circina FSU 941]
MADYDDEEQQIRDKILGLCTALGGFEESIDDNNNIKQVYSVGDEALGKKNINNKKFSLKKKKAKSSQGCLKDLKREIRFDSLNNQKVVLDFLAEFNIVETDIVPMILSFKDNRNEITDRFVLACVEILVPMTWPLEKNIDEQQEEDDYVDPNMMDSYRKYKSSLLTPGVFEIILDIIVGPLGIPYRERSIRDQTIIRLVLYLFRNLSSIPDIIASQSAAQGQIRLAHLQEQFVIRLYKSDILELLLTIASNTTNEADAGEWNVIVLEILYNIVKHVNPKDVFFYKEMRMNKTANNVRDVNETTPGKLGALLQRESASKRLKTGVTPTRHNRFGGTYVLQDWDGNSRVTHKQEGGFGDVSELIDGDKRENRVGKKRKLRNELYLKTVYQDPLSLKYIKTMSRTFLQSCFNAFFTSILKDIKREDKKILKNDITRYYHTMKWFLEFIDYEQKAFQQVQMEKKQKIALLAKDRLVLPGDVIPQEDEEEEDKPPYDFDLIAGVMNLGTVLYCLQMIRSRLDDKKWFELQVTADCFKQMLVTLASMGKSQEEEYREVAEYIQSSLYYEQFTFDLIVDLIKCYKNQPYEYLKIVVLLVHQLLKLLEQFLETKKVIFVRKRRALQKKKRDRERQGNDMEEGEEDEEEEDRQNKLEYKEHEFSFKSFENKFISSKVVETYCVLLECYQELPSEYIHYITSMFHRIMVKRKVEYFFWKLPVLDLFNRILHDREALPKTSAFKQLYDFILYATTTFFEGADQYPLLFVEALFPTRTDRSIWENPDANVIEDYIEDEEQRRKENEDYNSDGGDSIDRLINSPKGEDKRKEYDSDSGDSIDRLIKGPKRDKGKGRATSSNDIDPVLLETYFKAFDDLGKDNEDNDDQPLF